ncbi:hypothetical protein J6590_063308 [Homalodisca vitripennis]|nr:hypothetical protein J6590_063308 [Homalodisca vitripennis]
MLLNWCIVTVLTVVEESYADINKQVLESAMDKSNSRTLSPDEVNKWMEKHCSTGELLNSYGFTFGPYIILFVWNTFGELLFRVYFTFIFRDKEPLLINGIIIVKLLVDAIIVIGRRDAVVVAKGRTLGMLYKLTRRKSRIFNHATFMKMKLFEMYIIVRDRNIYAFGVSVGLNLPLPGMSGMRSSTEDWVLRRSKAFTRFRQLDTPVVFHALTSKIGVITVHGNDDPAS